jgi:2-keto-4-pentenoate hydratase/2-oxohepta-3-ene-1,7-dioic acid hydratase in catechol pathway
MATISTWKSLVRFRDDSREVWFGEPEEDLKKATIWEGKDILNLTPTSKTVNIAEILAPYIPDTIICIGLNYKEHAAESGVSKPLNKIRWI